MTEASRVYDVTETWGQELLESVPVSAMSIKDLKRFLIGYRCVPNYTDDIYVWATCVLALKASTEGNFGVGSILVDPDGRVVTTGYNQVFSPYFRSDHHAEMVVMNRFEDANQKMSQLKGYRLFTSLESCPMCMARLITSGIGIVLHAAPDTHGGMVHKRDNLPDAWLYLANESVFAQAECSDKLIDAASQIFSLNAVELDQKLRGRL